MRAACVIAALALCLGCLGGEDGGAPAETSLEVASTTVRAQATPGNEAEPSTSTTEYAEPAAASTAGHQTTSTAPKPRECRRPYIRDGFLCCMDADGNGLCDQAQPTTTTATTTTLSGFERLFGKVANKTYDAPLPNASSVNLGYNHPATTTTIENITAAYVNKYNVYFYRGYWNVGGHVNLTKCQVKDDKLGHLVYCPGEEPYYVVETG